MILCQQWRPAQCPAGTNMINPTNPSARQNPIQHRTSVPWSLDPSRTRENHLEKIEPVTKNDQQCHKSDGRIISLRPLLININIGARKLMMNISQKIPLYIPLPWV
jgi:hypothetical protein